tara:strand:+ start:119 stop:277 length:159 start_codon:yes stop_codon:yes gene_type:complete
MHNDVLMALLFIMSMCYIFGRIADSASESRQKQLAKTRELEKKKKIDSLYGR